MAVGVNVVVARYIGEGDKSREISAAIHTAVAMALVGGLILGGAGLRHGRVDFAHDLDTR